MDINNISIQKEWFVRDNKEQKIDECYDFDLKKVLYFLASLGIVAG